MHNVFEKKSAEELYVELSDGRMMPLEEIVKDYERFLSELKDDKPITSKLTVGEWFRIDRDVINENKKTIRYKCNEAGTKGKELWERFEKSNKIAEENPDQYPRLIETYVFKHNWDYKTVGEMRDMCEDLGKGMCDEVICDFELQMKICNGEPVHDLVIKGDKLPYRRVIKLRNGGVGFVGGGANFADNDERHKYPPARLDRFDLANFDDKQSDYVPYAFRWVLS